MVPLPSVGGRLARARFCPGPFLDGNPDVSGTPKRQPILNLPPTTQALLLANVLVQGARLLLSSGQDDALLETFGFAPARYVSSEALSWPALVSPITYQFLHGGLAHLGVNMLGLVAFGSGVEQRLGRWRFLAFYLLCGVAAASAQLAVDPWSDQLLIGASGAISGIFGAILRFQVARRSFWAVVALWLVLNGLAGATGMGSTAGPIAWIAHVGGFIAGLILFPLFDRRRAARS